MMTRPQKLIPVAGPARKPDGTPAGLTRPLDYPGQALCPECREPVRCERWFAGTWVHIERFPDPGSKTGMTAPVTGSQADYLDEVYPAGTGGTACHPGATA